VGKKKPGDRRQEKKREEWKAGIMEGWGDDEP
jgi:hypothetical protein